MPNTKKEKDKKKKSKKFQMPSYEEFWKIKRIFGPKLEPVWVYLEREMRENVHNKPYNEKVGFWLRQLKELRHQKYLERKRVERRMTYLAGPKWYMQLSTAQTNTLGNLTDCMHKDLIEDLPRRTQESLFHLGITPRVKDSLVMSAIKESNEDPGLFIWYLYTNMYKMKPCVVRKAYNLNAMILMSSIVSIDVAECIEELEKLTYSPPKKIEEPPKKKRPKRKPKESVYLERQIVPIRQSAMFSEKKKKWVKRPIGYKFKLKSTASFDNLRQDENFIKQRKMKMQDQVVQGRECKYKFWKPPMGFGSKTEDARKITMMRILTTRKAKLTHQPTIRDTVYYIGGVTFLKGRPYYQINGLITSQPPSVVLHGGIRMVNGEPVPMIVGLQRESPEKRQECGEACDCLKWYAEVLEYLKKTKCKCGHYYDFRHEGKCNEKFFHPPTKHSMYWFDYARIMQMNPLDNFIKQCVDNAVLSEEPSSSSENVSAITSGLSRKVLLKTFLADLSSTRLLIPHLPDAHRLPQLEEWIRMRLCGPLTAKQKRKMLLQTFRAWLQSEMSDFRALSFRVPLTYEQKNHITWAHRPLISRLAQSILENFVTRNKRNQVLQTRMWWPTMKYEQFPNQPFKDLFFTYMPTRERDTNIIDPVDVTIIDRYGGKTCPV